MRILGLLRLHSRSYAKGRRSQHSLKSQNPKLKALNRIPRTHSDPRLNGFLGQSRESRGFYRRV